MWGVAPEAAFAAADRKESDAPPCRAEAGTEPCATWDEGDEPALPPSKASSGGDGGAPAAFFEAGDEDADGCPGEAPPFPSNVDPAVGWLLDIVRVSTLASWSR